MTTFADLMKFKKRLSHGHNMTFGKASFVNFSTLFAWNRRYILGERAIKRKQVIANPFL